MTERLGEGAAVERNDGGAAVHLPLLHKMGDVGG